MWLCHQPLLHRHAAAGEEVLGIKNYADLAKKTVASTTGTTNAQVMRKYNTDKNLDMDIVLGKDHDDAFCWSRATAPWPSRWTTSCCSA